MSASYKHGVYVSEQDTSMVAPVLGTAGLQVVVGTAPINTLADPSKAVNVPILANSKKEAIMALGWSEDFDKYTLCEAISATFDVIGTGPLILINVLDPSKAAHKTALTTSSVSVSNHVAKIDEVGLIVDNTLSVQIPGSGGGDPTTLVRGTDYTVSFNEDGTANLIMVSVTAKAATTLSVAGNKLNPSGVTAADIVGSVDASTGAETGLEVIRQVFPKFQMTPGILTAPRFSASATVSAALQAKTKEINGVFSCVTIIDIDSGSSGAKLYSDVNTQKQTQAVSDPNAYAVWLYAKVGEKVYSGSSIAAALTAYVDAMNDDTPNVSPSNKTLNISGTCLADGTTEVLLDQDQANVVNGFGVATFLNFTGFRLWGNNTAAYPGTTDPKDRWFSVKRFFNWSANTFILTYFQKVDDPANKRLIEAIVDSENVRGNGFVSRGICARYQIVFNEEENTTADLLNGKITFHQYLTPYTPAEDIENVLEFDPDALSAALA
jgi:hypothetical protein